MPLYILLIVAVLIVATLSSRWQARLLARKNGNASLPEGEPTADDKRPLTKRVTDSVDTLRSKLFAGTQQPALSQRFWAWLNAVLPANDLLLAWLNALPAEATVAFTEQVAEFCTEMGFELTALVDGQLGHAPSAEQQATQIVLHYGYANYQAALAGAEFTASKRVLNYLRSPSSKANRAFGQKLHMKLVDKDVIPLPPFEILLTSEERRNAQALEAIRSAATQSPAAFNAALTEMLAESEASEPPTGMTQRLKRGATWVAGSKFKKTVPTDTPVIKTH